MQSVKPVLAMVHGWGMNAHVFDALGALLDSTFDVRMLNLPGHGGRASLPHNSLQDWADDLAGQLPDRSILLGWSLGGQVAMRAALDHPNVIERLVLLASTPRFVATENWTHGMAMVDLQAFGQALVADPAATLLRFLSLQTRGMANQKQMLHTLRESVLAAPTAHAESLMHGLALLRDTDLRSALPELSQPTLVIHGASDTLTPPGAGGWLANTLPHARHVELARAAHAPHLSHADIVAAEIRQFADAG